MLTADEQQLLKSYQAKTAAGKTPTVGERKAHQRAIETRVLEQLKAVRPAFFEDLFGVQNKQRYDWADRYGFPCGRGLKAIDAIATLRAFRQLIADNRKFIGQRTGDIAEDDMTIQEAKRIEAIEKGKKLKKQNAEYDLRVKALKRELIPAEEAQECFDMICNIWIRISKQLQKTGYEDAWEIVESGLTEARERFDSDILATGIQNVDLEPDPSE